MHDLDTASEAVRSTSLDEERERTLKEDLRKLSEEAKAYAEAEFQFQKSRTLYATSAVKSVIAFVVLALVLLFFAAMALIVGLVMALTPLITVWGATAVVTLGLLAIAVFLLLRAKRRVAIMTRVFGGSDS